MVKSRTQRYAINFQDQLFRLQQFRMTCEAVGAPIEIVRVIGVEYTKQDEPIYTRISEILEGYCLYDDNPDKRTRLGGKWLREEDGQSMLIHVPMLNYLDQYILELSAKRDENSEDPKIELTEKLFDEFIANFDGVGHLVTLPDDTPIQPSDTGTWIVEDNELSADRTFITFSLFPYRADQSDEFKPDTSGFSKPNGSLLNPR